jgi:pimeloyl-ACP methyl ester carboxylesterase
MNIKHDLLGRPLELKKTHDYCASSNPRLTVVFLHGVASDSRTFQKALEYLEGTVSLRDTRFVTFDLLGVGQSYKSDKIIYNYANQLEALDNSIKKLDSKTPLIIVGHSMGCLIAARYADKHRRAVSKLILVSPPMFTPEDLDDVRFDAAMEVFKTAVAQKDRSIVKEKSFNDSINKIVKNRKNYQTYIELTVPMIMIYGDKDELIASYNIPRAAKDNCNISTIVTDGKHGFSHEKYNKVREILEEELHAKTI